MTQKDSHPDHLKSSYAYELPEDLIALRPLQQRPRCRLLTWNRQTQERQHRYFEDLVDLLEQGSLLVVNQSKVLKTRVEVERETGSRGELMVLGAVQEKGKIKALARPAKKFKEGSTLKSVKNPEFSFKVLENYGDGTVICETDPLDLWPDRLSEIGSLPLPPYIAKHREVGEQDDEDYQCVFAEEPGSAAAPTAGLHFDDALLEKLKVKGIEMKGIILHVGLDTFLPMRSEHVADHQIHQEVFKIPKETVLSVNQAKAERRKVVAVGTTSVRALESGADFFKDGEEISGSADLFLYPPKKIKVADALITNFHLPESTLMMLVSCFCGRERLLSLYKEAIRERYRFYSYGDAMMINA